MESSIHNIQQYFEERMAKFEADLFKNNSTGTGGLAEEFGNFKDFIMQTMKSFSQQWASIARQVDGMETRSRRKMILLHGVEEEKNEDTAQVVVQVVKQRLKLDTFSTAEIKRCHRMGRLQSSKARPILIKLQSTSVRDSIWFAKTKLKGSGLTLSEFLTRTRHMAFMAAREKFGVTKVWTREGSVFVLGADGQRHRVLCLGDLNQIKGADPEKPAEKVTAAKTKRTAASKK